MASRSITVRRATPADAATVSELGRALNLHQGDPDQHFTPEAVRKDGFGADARFEAWLAELDGRPIGYALVVPAAYETGYAKAGVYVQDLYVSEEARRLGAGRALLASVAADARRRGLAFVWWASKAWNTGAHAFFRTLATAEEPVIAFAAFGDEFTRLADEGDGVR